MKLVLAASFAFSALRFADPDSQPACRQGCEEAYEEELVACKQQSRLPVDECQDAAQDRSGDVRQVVKLSTEPRAGADPADNLTT